MATRDVENGPVLGTPDDFPDRPERRGRFVVHVVIGLLVAIVAGGWGYVMWLGTGNVGVAKEVVTFNVKSPSEAEISFNIVKPADRVAVCMIRATDTDHREVGTKEVRIPAGEGITHLKERLATSAEATSVHIQYCNLV